MGFSDLAATRALRDIESSTRAGIAEVLALYCTGRLTGLVRVRRIRLAERIDCRECLRFLAQIKEGVKRLQKQLIDSFPPNSIVRVGFQVDENRMERESHLREVGPCKHVQPSWFVFLRGNQFTGDYVAIGREL